MAKKGGLGKGLGALISEASSDVNNEEVNTGVFEMDINDIEPNLDQPRKHFDELKIKDLADSILSHGMIQPIIVAKKNGTYKIIAGERRWRAAKLAGIKKVPVVIKDVSSQEIMEMALIENLQRQDLNSIEEAEAYNKLALDYDLTQEEIAETVGKSRSAVANTLRLLNLCEEVKRMIINEELTSGHARTLITVEDEYDQKAIAQYVVMNDLSVGETEDYIRKLNNPDNKKDKTKETKSADLKFVENELMSILGTKVNMKDKKDKGKIEIEYFSKDERERVIEMIYRLKKQ